jgi:hypothetical protein
VYAAFYWDVAEVGVSMEVLCPGLDVEFFGFLDEGCGFLSCGFVVLWCGGELGCCVEDLEDLGGAAEVAVCGGAFEGGWEAVGAEVCEGGGFGW